MPSISAALHKLSLGRHKRTGSTSSNGSAPNSPRQSLTQQREREESITPRSVSGPQRYIPDRPAPPPLDNVESTTKPLPLVPTAAPTVGTESARPNLPTTSSNVNNPPIPNNPPQLPPLPHVTSLQHELTPSSAASSSRSPTPAHVPPTIGGTPTVSLAKGQMEPRAEGRFGEASTSTTSTSDGTDPRYINNHWYSTHELKVLTSQETEAASAAHLAYHLKNLNLPKPSATPNVFLPKLALGQGGPSLEEQRQALVMSIAQAEANRPKQVVSEEGRRVFEKAGLGATLGIKDTIDVRTRWLEPVIQERVIRTERHEYRVEIYQDTHKYHIYPKIQPIYDPNPIILPTRHRFRDAEGNLREVIGDDAARRILGEGMDVGTTTYTRMVVPEYEMIWEDGCDSSAEIALLQGAGQSRAQLTASAQTQQQQQTQRGNVQEEAVGLAV